MQFKTSATGTPYIQLDAGRLIFSKSTAHPVKGYKYVCYSGTDTKTACVSSARAKKKKYAKIVEDINFTVRCKDFRKDDKKPFPTKVNVMSKISLNFIKNLIISNTVDGYLPFEKIPYLTQQINMDDPTDEWNDDPDVDDNDPDDWEDIETPSTRKPLKKGNGKRGKKLTIKQKISFKGVKPIKKGKK